MELSITIISSDGDVSQTQCASKGLADSTLLDVLRGKFSFGHKAFAIITNKNENQVVYIEDNTTKWMPLTDLFERLNLTNRSN
jgi:hypothetical protein